MGSWLLGEDQRLAALEAIEEGRYLTDDQLESYEKKVGRVDVAGLVSTCPEDSLAWKMAKSQLTPRLDSLGELLSRSVILIVRQKHPSYTSRRSATTSVIRRDSSACMALSQSMGLEIRCCVPSSSSPNSPEILNFSLRLCNPTITLLQVWLCGIQWDGRRRRRTSFSGAGHLPATVIQKARTETGVRVTDLDCISWLNTVMERETCTSSGGRSGKGRPGTSPD